MIRIELRNLFENLGAQQCPECNKQDDSIIIFPNNGDQQTQKTGNQEQQAADETLTLEGLLKLLMQSVKNNPINLILESPENKKVAKKHFPNGNLDNYRITEPDVKALQNKGHNDYNAGQNLNPRLNKILADDFGTYTSSSQMNPDQVNNITQGKINTNLDPKQFGLTQEQMNNAYIIASVVMQECKKAGKSPEETQKAIVVALATALQETSLKNLPHGMDGDNKGLFQQRNNWGTAQERMNPATATQKFAQALLKTDFADKQIWKAAQDVQRSGNPYAYQKRAPKATLLANAMLNKPTQQLSING